MSGFVCFRCMSAKSSRSLFISRRIGWTPNLVVILAEHDILKLHGKYVFFFRMEAEFEPLFASMALYDCKERKKVS